MSDSILDRVLTSREDQEKQEFNPVEVLNTLLKTLSNKEADVLRRRFGLHEGGKETLETIGAAYAVTRERIRQIENQAVQKMKASSRFAEVMEPVDHLIMSLLNHYGGIMTKAMMQEMLLNGIEVNNQAKQSIQFILSKLLNDKIDEIPKSKHHHAAWKLKLTSFGFVEKTVSVIEQVVKNANTPLTAEELLEQFHQTELYTQQPEQFSDDVVLSYIEVSAQLARNPFDEYGMASWGQIAPKRMNDRVYLILKKEGKPMHFSEIAKRIAKIFKKKAYPPTVHNELILNKEYVLVGRGIYALEEWGFKEGVVATVIEEILRKMGKPLTRSEIVDEVLQQRIVKKNTIHLALTDKTLFHKTSDGKYALAQEQKAN